MTKLKSKKLSKSTIAIIIMAIAMVALLSFGATFALFTATSRTLTSSNVRTGKVTVSATGAFYEATSSRIFPGQSIVQTAIQVAPTSSSDTARDTLGQYVAVKVTLSLTKNGDSNAVADPSQYLTLNWYEANQAEDKTYWAPTNVAGVYVYTGQGAEHTIYTTGTNLKDQTTLNAMTAGYMTATTEVLSGITFNGDDNAQENAEGTGFTYTNNLMDATITVSIQFRSMQVTANTGRTVSEIATSLFGA